MLWITCFRRPVSFRLLVDLLPSSIRFSSSGITSSNEDEEHRLRLSTTKKLRLLGLQSNQARQALTLYDDYVHRQKKKPDLRMFAIAINCAMLAKDLSKGREIHAFIERDFPHLKNDLMLRQQLRYFYIKCNDQASADKLFRQSPTTDTTTRTSDASNQKDQIKVK